MARDNVMTEQEAIEVLKNNYPKMCKMVNGRYQGGFDNTESDFGQALTMAISVLKEIQQYREIGTVEECREAVEKQRAKKTHIVTNELLGGTSYVCPNCGAEMMLIDRNRIQWGHMQKYCGCCGQVIDENLEGMEDD